METDKFRGFLDREKRKREDEREREREARRKIQRKPGERSKQNIFPFVLHVWWHVRPRDHVRTSNHGSESGGQKRNKDEEKQPRRTQERRWRDAERRDERIHNEGKMRDTE